MVQRAEAFEVGSRNAEVGKKEAQRTDNPRHRAWRIGQSVKDGIFIFAIGSLRFAMLSPLKELVTRNLQPLTLNTEELE
jgi:hypothetical protein